MEQEKPLPKSTKNVLKLFLEIFDLSAIPSKWQLFFKNVILYYTGPNLLTLKVAIYLKRKLHFFSVTFLQIYQKCIQNLVEHLKRRFGKIFNG